jgi:hypothetical protein
LQGKKREYRREAGRPTAAWPHCITITGFPPCSSSAVIFRSGYVVWGFGDWLKPVLEGESLEYTPGIAGSRCATTRNLRGS